MELEHACEKLPSDSSTANGAWTGIKGERPQNCYRIENNLIWNIASI